MTTLHEFRGFRYTMADLAKMTGIPRNTLYRRYYAGWTVEQMVTMPTPKQRRRGAVMNFAPSMGTGAGSTAQEIPEITFSEKANAR